VAGEGAVSIRRPPGLLEPLPRHIDPVYLRNDAGDLDGYARNSRGLHVPIGALTVREQVLAPSWRSLCEAVNFELMDQAAVAQT
jgi:hypothetical protein